jgi:hypothetical protein
MPNFKKSTGYKMKGSTFYGHGNSSPAKVSDEAVVRAQKQLDKTELKYEAPGWTKIAKAAAGTKIAKGLGSMLRGSIKKGIATKYPGLSKFLGEVKARGAGTGSTREFQWGDEIDTPMKK